MLSESEPIAIDERPSLAPDDLAAILNVWDSATDRLQRTHEALRAQVKLLTDELEAKNRELARRDRLADLGQMASHVAHEVRNGIVPLKLYLGLLERRTRSNPDLATLVERLAAGFGNLESTVNDLLHFTSDREPDRTEVRAAELVARVLDEIGPHLRAHRVRVDATRVEDAVCRCDSGMIRRALINLMLNAVDALPEGGRLTIEAGSVDGRFVWTVADDGPGIPVEIADRLFDPFVTTKATGTGLGLSIVERIAAAHGGTIAVESSAEGGATFRLAIPGGLSYGGSDRASGDASTETER